MKKLASRKQRIYKNWMETITENGKSFSDLDVATYVVKHMRIRDLLNPIAVVKATILAFDVFLEEAVITSPKKDWKFFDKDTKFEWR